MELTISEVLQFTGTYVFRNMHYCGPVAAKNMPKEL